MGNYKTLYAIILLSLVISQHLIPIAAQIHKVAEDGNVDDAGNKYLQRDAIHDGDDKNKM